MANPYPTSFATASCSVDKDVYSILGSQTLFEHTWIKAARLVCSIYVPFNVQ